MSEEREAAPPPLIAVVGPTAAGKSALALEVCRRFGGEIVNADALQVYRGLDIGTAKPSPEERREVPHHLLDILEPDERYSAGEFARRARTAIADIRGRGRLPVVTGGSGLYLRALLEGISPVPSYPEERLRLRQRLEREGLPALYEQLGELDPETAERLPPSDPQRILRALEVALGSGVPLSDWIARQPFGEKGLAAVRVGLTLPRSILYDRIAGRAVRMLEMGWVGEVGALLRSGVRPEAPAFQAIGYRELVRTIQGELPLDEALELIVRATRRFAKRQLTWFRKEPDIEWFTAPLSSRRDIEALQYLGRIFKRSGSVGGS